MALVPHEMVERFRQFPDSSPISNATFALDKEMKDILNRSDLKEDEKIKLYNQTLRRYLALDHQRKQPLEMKLTTTLPTPPSGPSETETKRDINGSVNDKVDSGYKLDVESDVLDSVPRTLRKKAERLLRHIKLDQNVLDWNKKGELITKGTVIAGSHLVDLINDAIRKRKNFNPRGWKEFNNALSELNTPQDLVGNIDRWKYQQSSSNAGDDTLSNNNKDDVYADGLDSSSELFAEAYHLKPLSSSSKKKKKQKRRKSKHNFFDDNDDDNDMVVSSTTPRGWSAF